MKSQDTKSLSAYQHQSKRLVIVFLFGDDMNSTILTRISGGLGLSFLVLFLVASVILCFLRRKLNFKRNGLISAHIDLIIFSMGGGNIVINHKLERMFFTIYYTGFFFYWSIYTSSTFSNFFLIHESVTTLNKLSTIEIPIYVAQSLVKYEDIIKGMLRFVCVLIK